LATGDAEAALFTDRGNIALITFNMSANAIQAGLFVIVVALLVKPVGAYLENVFERRQTLLDPIVLPIERLIHRLVGIDFQREMDWKRYSLAFCVFGMVNIVLLYFALRWQAWFPWFFPNVMKTPMTADLAANTAVSFATTTTWQAYAGEITMSYLSQLLLAGQNFLAGAAGLAVGVAFIRGYARERTTGLGNFWFDLIRAGVMGVIASFARGEFVFDRARRADEFSALHRRAHTGRCRASHRPRSPLRHWSLSRISVLTVAAFSTPTVRIHSRIPRR
jgi:putative Mn2+ efflux pump MntP